jgi:hypothetical protein
MARSFNMPLRTSTTVTSLFDCSWHSQQIAEYIIGGRHQDRYPRDGYQVFECPLMIFAIVHLGSWRPANTYFPVFVGGR